MAVATETRVPAPEPPAAEQPPARRRLRRRLFRWELRYAPYAYVTPFFLLFAVFGLFPLLFTAWISLHTYRLGSDMSFTGLDNYRWLFTSPEFYNALLKTFTIGVIGTVPQLLIAIGIAQLLNYRLRGRSFFRVVMIMPYATSVAAATLVFAQIFGRDAGLRQLGAVARRLRRRRLAQRRLDGADRHRRHHHLALDRLQRPHLPGRHAVDPAGPLRVGGPRRRQPLAAVRPHHAARPASDDPVHRRRLDHRRHPAVRRAAAVRRQPQRRGAAPVPDPRPADVPAGLGVPAARPRRDDRLGDVPAHHRAGARSTRPWRAGA